MLSILEKPVQKACFLCLPNFVRLERKCGEIVLGYPFFSPKQFMSHFMDYLSLTKQLFFRDKLGIFKNIKFSINRFFTASKKLAVNRRLYRTWRDL